MQDNIMDNYLNFKEYKKIRIFSLINKKSMINLINNKFERIYKF